MDDHQRHQVSLRGASAREISRDALLEKVSQERELRNYTRRATAAALFIQRVWRRYATMKLVALQLQQQWETTMTSHAVPRAKVEISMIVLRPFLFFTKVLSRQCNKIQARDINCMKICFVVLLESINSTNPHENFCSMAVGTIEERRLWTYQSRKLISLCLYILSEYDNSSQGGQHVFITSLAMRLAVVLTDLKGWKCITGDDIYDAKLGVKELVCHVGSMKSGLHHSIRRYICKLEVRISSQAASSDMTDDRFLITASAVTLALRPFHIAILSVNEIDTHELQFAVEQYCLFLLTIPWFTQRLPAVLIPALKHKLVLSPCLKTLLYILHVRARGG